VKRRVFKYREGSRQSCSLPCSEPGKERGGLGEWISGRVCVEKDGVDVIGVASSWSRRRSAVL